MSVSFRLTPTRLLGGIWEGFLEGTGAEPRLRATHEGRELGGLSVTEAEGGWLVRLSIPAETISDGVQTYLIADEGGEVLASVALVAGEALAHDLRAEIDLLRAELDMLKRAFRRHCAETQG